MAVNAICSASPQNGSAFVFLRFSTPSIISATWQAKAGSLRHVGTKFQRSLRLGSLRSSLKTCRAECPVCSHNSPFGSYTRHEERLNTARIIGTKKVFDLPEPVGP